MTLHVRVEGDGPDLVLLHGWGLHSRVWNSCVARWRAQFRCHAIDLPGHGASDWDERYSDLRAWTEAVVASLPARAHVVGWSLGGEIAQLLAATHAQHVRSLVLVSTTPKFVAAQDWPYGTRMDLLENVAKGLSTGYVRMLEDFLALQVRGDEHAARTLATLKEEVLSQLPHRDALGVGLEILRRSDLRPLLPNIYQPTLVVAGEYDRVALPGAAHFLAQAMPKAQLHTLRRAGHAPFLSHESEFVALCASFWAGLDRSETLTVRAP